MALEGFQFTHCISNYPVCSPYRAILMSGRWPYRNRVIDNNIPLAPEGSMLGDRFRGAGYRTAYIGKWHLGGTRAEPFGFEHSLIWTDTNTHWDTSVYHPAEGEPVQPKGYNATLMTDQALEYIREHHAEGHDAPYFLMLSLNPPHADFTDAPEDKKALYPRDSLPYRPNVDLTTADPRGVVSQNGYPFYEGYHAHISAIDDEVGRLMRALEEGGHTRDTILIYSSDHGSQHGSHGVGSKRQPYEESIRVPFLAWQPGVIPAGRSTDALLGAIDKYPTLCGLAGIEAPDECDGKDFSSWVYEDRGPNPVQQFIMHISKRNASGGDDHPAPIFRGLRTKRYTFAHEPGDYRVLFDNSADPYQMNNLAYDRRYRWWIEQFTLTTQRLCEKAGDPYRLFPIDGGPTPSDLHEIRGGDA